MSFGKSQNSYDVNSYIVRNLFIPEIGCWKDGLNAVNVGIYP